MIGLFLHAYIIYVCIHLYTLCVLIITVQLYHIMHICLYDICYITPLYMFILYYIVNAYKTFGKIGLIYAILGIVSMQQIV